MYAALNQGHIDAGRLRRTLAALPQPRAAAAGLSWLSMSATGCASTSAGRLFCHTFGCGRDQHLMLSRWPYSFVTALESGRTSWCRLLNTVRLAPEDDVAETLRRPGPPRRRGPHRRRPLEARRPRHPGHLRRRIRRTSHGPPSQRPAGGGVRAAGQVTVSSGAVGGCRRLFRSRPRRDSRSLSAGLLLGVFAGLLQLIARHHRVVVRGDPVNSKVPIPATTPATVPNLVQSARCHKDRRSSGSWRLSLTRMESGAGRRRAKRSLACRRLLVLLTSVALLPVA
ncbi:transposase [Streptomyces inhibens]|uniref:transposase n=1 Tax=Streptomyces inhibens TaxID=2293571 RepID=UPI0015F297A1|nr:transposase [Streptomyces inhibens]